MVAPLILEELLAQDDIRDEVKATHEKAYEATKAMYALQKECVSGPLDKDTQRKVNEAVFNVFDMFIMGRLRDLVKVSHDIQGRELKYDFLDRGARDDIEKLNEGRKDLAIQAAQLILHSEEYLGGQTFEVGGREKYLEKAKILIFNLANRICHSIKGAENTFVEQASDDGFDELSEAIIPDPSKPDYEEKLAAWDKRFEEVEAERERIKAAREKEISAWEAANPDLPFWMPEEEAFCWRARNILRKNPEKIDEIIEDLYTNHNFQYAPLSAAMLVEDAERYARYLKEDNSSSDCAP